MPTLKGKTTQDEQAVATVTASRSTTWQSSGEFATEDDYRNEVARLTAELRSENIRIRQLRREGWL